MKRIAAVVIAFLILCSFAAADTIGENYEKGGAVLGGSGYLYTNLEGYRSVSLSPWIEFLVSDGLALGVELTVYSNTAEEFSFSWSPFLGYTFGYDPKASTGPAHHIAISAGGTISRDAFGSLPIEGFVFPSYTFYYYITPRLAPYLQLTGISVNFNSDVGGADFSKYLRLRFGMSFHMPNRDRTLGGT